MPSDKYIRSLQQLLYYCYYWFMYYAIYWVLYQHVQYDNKYT